MYEEINKHHHFSRYFVSFLRAQGTQAIEIDRLKKQLDKAVKDEKRILEDLIKKQKAGNIKESAIDSDSYPSNTGSGKWLTVLYCSVIR